MSSEYIFWCCVALAGLIAGKAALLAAPFGPLGDHMAMHILLMSVVSPALALALLAIANGTGLRLPGRPMGLATATTVQLSLLWGWHTPPAIESALHEGGMHNLMQASLFAAALWFWFEIFADRGAFRWRALFALMVTGKLFCLLGVLLVFAPRAIYAGHTQADQHLAGLLMVVACPLTYVLAGVTIAARWLHELSDAAARRVTAAPSHLIKS